jgi:hypothetical protein
MPLTEVDSVVHARCCPGQCHHGPPFTPGQCHHGPPSTPEQCHHGFATTARPPHQGSADTAVPPHQGGANTARPPHEGSATTVRPRGNFKRLQKCQRPVMSFFLKHLRREGSGALPRHQRIAVDGFDDCVAKQWPISTITSRGQSHAMAELAPGRGRLRTCRRPAFVFSLSTPASRG